MKRTKLADRTLPAYTRGQEIMNMVTHIVGGGFGIIVLLMCLTKVAGTGDALNTTGVVIYGTSMIAVYTISSIYHGMKTGTAKKVLQILDHCTIYFLIAGTYTPILLSAFVPTYPAIGWGLLAAEWFFCILAATLSAIDLRKYRVFSKVCYVVMGWGVAFFLPQCIEVMTPPGFCFLLSGGIAYTIGAILFGIGVKLRWMHCVFHIFVVLGSLLQFISIFGFAL